MLNPAINLRNQDSVSMQTYGKLLFIMLVVLVAIVQLASTPQLSALTTNDNHTKVLNPRQCVWDVLVERYRCNTWLPSLNQFKERMLDVADGGGAIPEASVVSHTNLIPPDEKERIELYSKITQQLRAHGINRYYTDMTALNSDWQSTQIFAVKEQNDIKPRPPG